LRKEEEKTPAREHIYNFQGSLFTFDQSLAHTGWVHLRLDKTTKNGVSIWGRGQFDAPDRLEGHAANIKRSIYLHNEMYEMMMDYADRMDVVVCEMPPVANRMQRPESSLLAASMLHLAASRIGIDVNMISAQTAKKIWTGNGSARKELIKVYLCEWWPELKEIKLTSHQIDAAANGLAWAETWDPTKENEIL